MAGLNYRTLYLSIVVQSFVAYVYQPNQGVDLILPRLTCPGNIRTVIVDGGGIHFYFPEATASDNSGGMVQLTYSHPRGSFFSIGDTVVTVIGTDPSGNQATCTFTITVLADSTPPQLTCPANQQAEGQGGAFVNFPDATASDSSGGLVQLSYSPLPGSFFSIGDTEVIVTGTDPSGNQATCTFAVIVTDSDSTPPQLTCPDNQQAEGQGGAFVNFAEATASDNSGGFVQLSYSHQHGSFFSIGDTEVTVIGIDPNGNLATCQFTVTVTDQSEGSDSTPPQVTCPANQQAEGQGGAFVNFPIANGSDNSGGLVQLSYSHPPGSFFSIGDTVVTVTGTDPSGNQATCTFAVIVTDSDTTPPQLVCPANQEAQGQGGSFVNFPIATASDNSGGLVQLSYSHPPGSFFSIGDTEVTVTGIYPSGNQGICQFTVTVTENSLTTATTQMSPTDYVQVDKKSPSEIHINWSTLNTDDDISQFRVLYGITDGSINIIIIDDIKTNTIKLSGLEPGTPYSISVEALTKTNQVINIGEIQVSTESELTSSTDTVVIGTATGVVIFVIIIAIVVVIFVIKRKKQPVDQADSQYAMTITDMRINNDDVYEDLAPEPDYLQNPTYQDFGDNQSIQTNLDLK